MKHQAVSGLHFWATTADLPIADSFVPGDQRLLWPIFGRSDIAPEHLPTDECGKPLRCEIGDGLIAIVTDMDEVYPQLRHFALDDIVGLVNFLLRHPTR